MSNDINTTNNNADNNAETGADKSTSKCAGKQACDRQACGPRSGKRGKFKIFLAALAFVGIGSVVAAKHCYAHDHGMRMGHGPHAMFHGGDHGGMEKHLDGFIKNAIPNANEQQRKQIHDIAKAAMDDLKVIREQNKSLREQSATILTAQKVDRNAIEQQRQQIMKISDQASLRVSKAIADIADVLTVEQRKEMAEKMKKRMG